ncbi:putative ferric-chelate reductase 1 homolog [Mya arenaria]|uniref:putative ferric-chelate reductase 1 homolog n=1 Tax=Mya arenaria TaxID=6604 RepID=UPI0022E42B7D|nr:putative ferric-chelate reductase 1 homolog [Mya arenaria]XP_052807860.1 putative ferric-chelate reductase 1 homolog [Mya arenaria]
MGFIQILDARWIILVLAVVKPSYGTVAWDSACGVSKGCFPDCQSSGCSYLVTWDPAAGSTITFNMKADESETNMYLALGFSSDLRMGDDSVVACFPPSGSNAASVQSWFNEGDDSDPLSPSSTGLSGTAVTQSNGVISCDFTRDVSVSGNSQFFDLNTQYRLMLVLGEAEYEDGAWKMEEHHMIPWTSDGKVNFLSTSIYSLYKLNSPLVKLHGIMMVLAWMLCCTVGIVIARYQKDMLPDKKLFDTKYWFQLHRGSMIGLVVFGVIGFIPIFVELEGYSQLTPPSSKSATKAHPILGIICTVIMFLNPVMGLLRPGGDHKLRPLFNWAHLGVGVIGHILAVVATMMGLAMERSDIPVGGLITGLIWLGVIFIFAIIMEVLKWRDNKNKQTVDTKNAANGMEMEEKKEEKQKQATSLNFILFLVFCVVMFCFFIAIMAVIAAS